MLCRKAHTNYCKHVKDDALLRSDAKKPGLPVNPWCKRKNKPELFDIFENLFVDREPEMVYNDACEQNECNTKTYAFERVYPNATPSAITMA